MKILGTGLSGLVGSRIVELLGPQYEFENISRATGVAITDKEQVSSAISRSSADIVLHLAAKTDVDGCEKEKDLAEESEAWKINVVGTQNVADACVQLHKKMIYISTDFVFDGEKPQGQFYTEEDIPNPINWYAKTKYEGEKVLQSRIQNGLKFIILRIAYPYRAQFTKSDFFRSFKSRLEQKQPIAAITDQFYCPTFIDDIAQALDLFLKSKEAGIFHCVGGRALTPYDAAVAIAEDFGLDKSLISKTTRGAFFKDRAARPFNLTLKNGKIEKLGLRMKTFEQGLEAIKKQL